jgi:Predicted transcription factor, homolog of eukaryotic MBF1
MKDENIGKRIRMLRKSKNMSIDQLIWHIYEKTGSLMDEKTIRRVENSATIPGLETLKKIAAGLGFDISGLNDDITVLVTLMFGSNADLYLGKQDAEYEIDSGKEDQSIVDQVYTRSNLEKVNTAAYHVLFPKERDLFLSDHGYSSVNAEKMFQYPIMTLFEFLIYLPLMDPFYLSMALSAFSLDYGGPLRYQYILKRLTDIYLLIPDGPAKNAADKTVKEVRYEYIKNELTKLSDNSENLTHSIYEDAKIGYDEFAEYFEKITKLIDISLVFRNQMNPDQQEAE